METLYRNSVATGKLVAYAQHAAIVAGYGCTMNSAKFDFGRFPEVRWQPPLYPAECIALISLPVFSEPGPPTPGNKKGALSKLRKLIKTIVVLYICTTIHDKHLEGLKKRQFPA